MLSLEKLILGSFDMNLSPLSKVSKSSRSLTATAKSVNWHWLRILALIERLKQRPKRWNIWGLFLSSLEDWEMCDEALDLTFKGISCKKSFLRSCKRSKASKRVLSFSGDRWMRCKHSVSVWTVITPSSFSSEVSELLEVRDELRKSNLEEFWKKGKKN